MLLPNVCTAAVNLVSRLLFSKRCSRKEPEVCSNLSSKVHKKAPDAVNRRRDKIVWRKKSRAG